MKKLGVTSLANLVKQAMGRSVRPAEGPAAA
jgi:hypothetical protein